MKYFSEVAERIGIVLMIAATFVMLGWLSQSTFLVQLHHSQTAMVFNSALCLFATGAAFVLPQSRQSSFALVRTLIGAALIGIAGFTVLEIIVDLPVSIDNTALHAWLHDDNAWPGRMALNTALGFGLTGLALVLMQRPPSRLTCAAIQLATFSVIILGITGLAGYSLELNLLYQWLDAPRMSLHSAVGLNLAGIGLWHSWRKADWYQSRQFFNEGEKIGYMSAGIVISVAMTIGVTGLAVQENSLRNSFQEILPRMLQSYVTTFDSEIRHAIAGAVAIAGRPDLIRAATQAIAAPSDAGTKAALAEIGENVLASGVTGIALYDADQRPLMLLGRFTTRPEVRIDLGLSTPATLIWEHELFLLSRTPVLDRGVPFGTLVIERTLPVVTEQFSNRKAIGDSGEMGICSAHGDQLLCLPQQRNPRVYQAARLASDGTPTPMHLAVQGQAGLFNGMDYRGHRVFAAYAPLLAPGLGIVLKQDTDELYAPIRRQLEWSLPLLLLLVTAGAFLLHSQTRPLVIKLMRSERDAIDKEQRIRSVVDHVGEGIITMNESGIIESFNNAATRIFGYAADEVIGHNLMMLMPPDMRAAHHAGLMRYLASGTTRIVGQRDTLLPGLHKSGKVFDLELTTTENIIDERKLFVGIVRDVTERRHASNVLAEAHAELEKRVIERTAELQDANRLLQFEVRNRMATEEALQRTKMLLNHAQKISHLGSWQLDIKSGAMEWSDEFWRLCGLERSSVLPSIELAISRLHPEDQDSARAGLRLAIDNQADYKRERRIVRPDGTIRHVMSQGEIIYDDNHEAILLIGIFLDITDYRMAVEALEDSQDQLREMAAHHDRIEQEERKRVAREIHDELGGVLTGIKSYLAHLIDNVERLGNRPDRNLLEASALANSAIDTVRRVITDLRPSVLDQLGLWAALDWYSREVQQSTGLQCELAIDSATASTTIDAERSTAVFRIVQESLTNVARHAKALHVKIDVRTEKESLMIKLQDDGIGIAPPHLRNQGSWGIVGMVERARYFGGDIDIAGIPGEGTTVTLTMPKERIHD